MSDSSPLGRRAPEQRRQAVLDAARALFIESGPRSTSIDAIARRAGVAKGTVYLSFPSKDDILQAIEADFDERIVQRVRTAADDAPAFADPAEAWCTEFVHAYLDELAVHDLLFFGRAGITREAVADNALIDDLAATLEARGAGGRAGPAARAAFLVGGVTMVVDRAIAAGSADRRDALVATVLALIRAE